MRLSLAMIVKDEEAHLGHCLDSVRGLVDEIIVVDTGSRDATPSLARDKGAQVFLFPWAGDFAAARNESLAHATGDWVLVLDADEAIDTRDHEAIRKACAQESIHAYRVLIRSYLPDGAYTLMDTQAKANPGGYLEGAAFAHCGDTRAVRLFRRAPWVAFQSRIHETVDAAFQARGLAMPDLDTVIHHYGFTLAPRVEAKKAIYLDLARRDIQDDPENLSNLFHLVIQAATAEDWVLASEAAANYRAAAGPKGAPPTVLLTQALAQQRLDQHEKALGTFLELMEAAPGSIPAAVGRGVSLERLGRREEARRIFETCIQEHPDYTTTYLDLADLLQRAGDPGAAEGALRRGLAVSPQDASLWGRLIRLDLEGGDPEGAVRDAWEAIQRCPRGGEGAWHKLVGVFLLRQGAADEGRQVIALGLEAFPGHADLERLMGSF